MKAKDLIAMTTKAVPRAAEWDRAAGEAYGAYHIDHEADVKRVLYCVTPTPRLITFFKKSQYDVLISHHPYVAGVPQLVFHTALDCCDGGLNDQWRDALDVTEAKHFDGNLGWFGKVRPIAFPVLVEKVRAFAGDVIGQVHWTGGTRMVESVVICTGLGGLVASEASATNADVYIIGENLQAAETTGTAGVIEVGHTLSEWMGVNLFKRLLEPQGIVVDLAPLELDVFGCETFKGQSARRRFS